jgi:Gas vesicle synthesis protein GvpL/GvpF
VGEAPADAESSESRGVAYLQRRQQERALADQASEVRARCVEVVHQQVEGLARASTVNPPQRPEVHGRQLTMLFNGAYLTERGRTAELRAVVEGLHQEWCSLGFTIELTGPWPPYNFVSGAAGVMS